MGVLLTLAITVGTTAAGGAANKADKMAIMADDFRRSRAPAPQGLDTGGVDYHIVTLPDGRRIRAVIETYHSYDEYVDAQVAIAEGKEPEVDWTSGVQDASGFHVITDAVVGVQDQDKADTFPANPPPLNGDPPLTVGDRTHWWTVYGMAHLPRR